LGFYFFIIYRSPVTRLFNCSTGKNRFNDLTVARFNRNPPIYSTLQPFNYSTRIAGLTI